MIVGTVIKKYTLKKSIEQNQSAGLTSWNKNEFSGSCHKRQRRKRQSVTAKLEKSQTPKVLTAILTLPYLT